MPRGQSSRQSSSSASCVDLGVLALGSHRERHGILPEDLDAKLASYVALQASLRTGAKFLGTVLSSHELPGINTGSHQSKKQVLREIRCRLKEAKSLLGIKGVVIVNGHGGNSPLSAEILRLGEELGLRMEWDSTIVQGPHAGPQEYSMACALGLVDAGQVKEHLKHPEVGFQGMPEVLRRYRWAAEALPQLERFRVSKGKGKRLLERSIKSVVEKLIQLSRSS